LTALRFQRKRARGKCGAGKTTVQRRHSVSILGAALAVGQLFAGTFTVEAQTAGRTYRVGHLANTALGDKLSREIALPELAKLGFVEGRNLVFDGRIGEPDALPGLMGDLLAAKPDVVVVIGPAVMKAAHAATRTVPIISFGADPVEMGFASSYAQPGGNFTGVAILAKELEAKRLSLLRDALPGKRRFAALISAAGNPVSEPALKTAAATLGVELVAFRVASSADYPAAFAGMRAAGAEALVISATPEFFNDGKQLAALALEAKLPTVCEWAEMARVGCLIGYGPVRVELRRRMAHQIAAVLRGEPVGKIPIELPVRFDFAVNQQIAKALGLTIPEGVLLQASEVIE
jgi:putative tryptophan/tyrosine transport system substrate-binding protein